MLLTLAAGTAMQLGHRLAMSADRGHQAMDTENLAAMRQDLASLGGDPALLPDAAEAFRADPFGQKLDDRLRLAGVQVWFASHGMKAGQKIRAQVSTAIGSHDKLLLASLRKSDEAPRGASRTG